MTLEFYCPKCGEVTTKMSAFLFNVAPGNDRWVCVECYTVWEVSIQYEEVEHQETLERAGLDFQPVDIRHT